MSTRRITLTLPEALIDAAEAAVAEGRARSVSAYVATAAGAGEARMSLAEVMHGWATAAGDRPPDELAAADEWARRFMTRNDARHAQRHHTSGTAA